MTSYIAQGTHYTVVTATIPAGQSMSQEIDITGVLDLARLDMPAAWGSGGNPVIKPAITMEGHKGDGVWRPLLTAQPPDGEGGGGGWVPAALPVTEMGSHEIGGFPFAGVKVVRLRSGGGGSFVNQAGTRHIELVFATPRPTEEESDDENL